MQVAYSTKKSKTSQIEKCGKLRATIIEKLSILMSTAAPEEFDGADDFLCELESAAPSFDVGFESHSIDAVDRTLSMLSGPFFTTKKYPIPSTGNKKAYPVVQLDLRLASTISGIALGDGLLQLWYMKKGKTGEGIVRVIPRSEVTEKKQTAFEWIPFSEKKLFQLPLPMFNWDSAAEGPEVKIISDIFSMGIMFGGCNLSSYCNAEIPKNLETQIDRFVRLSSPERSSVISLFGPFWTCNSYDDHDEVDRSNERCLLSITDWDNWGGAEIAYQIGRRGKAVFRFREGQNL